MMLLSMLLTTVSVWPNNVTVTNQTTWTNGNTYNVTSNVTITERITVTGTVTLNLGAGYTLTAEKGITVGSGNSLTITGSGTLNADMSKNDAVASNDQLNAAAIGGGIYVDADHDGNSAYGTITINGGTVYARSDRCAGIGCSAVYSHVTGSGGTININGGNVTAISKSDFCAGIGGSKMSEAGTINISGGVVVAEAYGQGYSPDPGPAIGNGGYSNGTRGGGTINITGGQITATQCSNGLGYGEYHGSETMTVNLSWTNATDFIDVKSISASTLTFTKAFLYGSETCVEQTAASFAGQTMVPADWKVTFDAGASSSTYNALGVKDGTTISAPATDPVPTDATLSFAGWLNGSTPYDFSAAVTSNLTLTAQYIADFTVSGLKHLYNHTGSAIDLGYSVANVTTSDALTAGTDYTAVIKNSANVTVASATDKDIYTLTVTGQGAYAGIKKTFTFVVDNVVTLGGYDFINLGTDIYGISTPELLEDLASYTNGGGATTGKTFKLTRNITFDTSQSNNHAPIGSNSHQFFGSFDGQSHTVSGIRISTTSNYQGLFGYVNGTATIQHVTVDDADITSGDYAGGIAGYNWGTISDCAVTGSVAIKACADNKGFLGGIVGYNIRSTVAPGTVIGCACAATINPNGHGNIQYVGGLVGDNGGYIQNSIYTGGSTFGAGLNFGYITGYEENARTAITNCYHTGTDENTNGIYTNKSDDSKYTTFASGKARTITAGDYVTSMGFSGTATAYTTSGITVYADGAGMKYGSTLYATGGETVSMQFSAARTGYTLSVYKLGNATMTPESWGELTDATKWTAVMEGANVTVKTYWRYELTITGDEGMPDDAAAHDGENVNVTFVRSFPFLKQTVCLPFNPGELLTKGQIWEFTGIEDGKAVMTERTSGLSANTPYIFEHNSSAAFTSIRFKNVQLNIGSDPKTDNGELVFHGTYAEKTWEADEAVAANIYGFMQADNDGQSVGQFVKARRKTILRPFSCWLEKTTSGALDGTQTAAAPARGMTRGDNGSDEPEVIGIIWRSASGETTGIGSLNLRTGEITDDGDDAWYALDGRRLNGKPSGKGVYINRGRKIVIK